MQKQIQSSHESNQSQQEIRSYNTRKIPTTQQDKFVQVLNKKLSNNKDISISAPTNNRQDSQVRKLLEQKIYMSSENSNKNKDQHILSDNYIDIERRSEQGFNPMRQQRGIMFYDDFQKENSKSSFSRHFISQNSRSISSNQYLLNNISSLFTIGSNNNLNTNSQFISQPRIIPTHIINPTHHNQQEEYKCNCKELKCSNKKCGCFIRKKKCTSICECVRACCTNREQKQQKQPDRMHRLPNLMEQQRSVYSQISQDQSVNSCLPFTQPDFSKFA